MSPQALKNFLSPHRDNSKTLPMLNNNTYSEQPKHIFKQNYHKVSQN